MLKKRFWGKEIDPYEGLDKKVLSNVCKAEIRKFKLPIMYWTSEIYSFGKAFREWLGIPKWLHLPFYSDHGYTPLRYLQSHELNNSSNIHVTFNQYRYEKIKDIKSKKIIYLTNPYVHYRRIKNFQQNENAKGTLVFYTHSLYKVDLKDYNLNHHLHDLNSLPDKYKPIVFMFHYNDIKKGNHLEILKRGYPILTAGNQYSWNYFIDRFYDIICHFKYATSNSGGSDLMYCTEMGLEYFILGKEPSHEYKGNNKERKKYFAKRNKKLNEIDKKKRNLFHYESQAGKKEKHDFIKKCLGLNTSVSKKTFKKLLMKEYIKTLPDYLKISSSKIIDKIS